MNGQNTRLRGELLNYPLFLGRAKPLQWGNKSPDVCEELHINFEDKNGIGEYGKFDRECKRFFPFYKQFASQLYLE